MIFPVYEPNTFKKMNFFYCFNDYQNEFRKRCKILSKMKNHSRNIYTKKEILLATSIFMNFFTLSIAFKYLIQLFFSKLTIVWWLMMFGCKEKFFFSKKRTIFSHYVPCALWVRKKKK